MGKIDKIMTRHIFKIEVSKTLQEAKDMFINHHIRHLPVVFGNELVGMLSRNDLMRLSFGDTYGNNDTSVDATLFDMLSIKDIMTHHPVVVQSNQTINEVASVLVEQDFHALPVVEEDKLVGIITIGDVREASPSDATTLSIWELNYLWAQLTVEKIMTREVLTATSDMNIVDAAQIMLEHKVSGLPVVEEEDKLVGVVTESDIFRMLIKTRTD